MNLRQRLTDLADRTQRSQLWLAAAALVVLMMVTVLDVFMRYVFNRPIRASLDTVEVMLLVFVFNGMAAAFFGRRHIVIDLLDGVFGARFTSVLIRSLCSPHATHRSMYAATSARVPRVCRARISVTYGRISWTQRSWSRM